MNLDLITKASFLGIFISAFLIAIPIPVIATTCIQDSGCGMCERCGILLTCVDLEAENNLVAFFPNTVQQLFPGDTCYKQTMQGTKYYCSGKYLKSASVLCNFATSPSVHDCIPSSGGVQTCSVGPDSTTGSASACCDGYSSCINTLTDSKNCGWCGHSCPIGLNCIDGVCKGTTPTTTTTTTIQTCQQSCGGSTGAVCQAANPSNCNGYYLNSYYKNTGTFSDCSPTNCWCLKSTEYCQNGCDSATLQCKLMTCQQACSKITVSGSTLNTYTCTNPGTSASSCIGNVVSSWQTTTSNDCSGTCYCNLRTTCVSGTCTGGICTGTTTTTTIPDVQDSQCAYGCGSAAASVCAADAPSDSCYNSQTMEHWSDGGSCMLGTNGARCYCKVRSSCSAGTACNNGICVWNGVPVTTTTTTTTTVPTTTTTMIPSCLADGACDRPGDFCCSGGKLYRCDRID
jgi:hypothetical protein